MRGAGSRFNQILGNFIAAGDDAGIAIFQVAATRWVQKHTATPSLVRLLLLTYTSQKTTRLLAIMSVVIAQREESEPIREESSS